VVSTLILSRQRYFLLSEEVRQPINESFYDYDTSSYKYYDQVIYLLSKASANKALDEEYNIYNTGVWLVLAIKATPILFASFAHAMEGDFGK